MARNERCYLCGSGNAVRIADRIRERDDIGVLRCGSCGLVYLDSFDHIARDYYESGYTTDSYTSETWQELLNRYEDDHARRAEQLRPITTNRRYLEVGCETGGVLLKLRGVCAEIAGVEPQVKWRAALQQESVPMYAALEDVPAARFDVIGCFHVLEHVADPLPFLREVASRAVPSGRILIEVPNADDALLALYNSSSFARFTYCSAHLFLYNAHTLRTMVERAGLVVEACVQLQRYPVSNHLMWLARNAPGGHVKWSFLNSPPLSAAYAAALAEAGMCDTLLVHAIRPA
jgi:2-polyprenyl-3-methyl-5-hydroxy-6-metoxy-1,4-benzoquinol methylase